MAGCKLPPLVFKSEEERLAHEEEIRREIEEMRRHFDSAVKLKPVADVTPEEEEILFQEFCADEVETFEDAGIPDFGIWGDIR